MNIKLLWKLFESILIIIILLFSLNNYNNFFIFFKNFQNSNLLFKSSQFDDLKFSQGKILLYNQYLEKNFNIQINLLDKKDFYLDNSKINKNQFKKKFIFNEKDFDQNITGRNTLFRNNNMFYKISNSSSEIENNFNFINNIEYRSFNAILSYNISEILKFYLVIIFYFMIKVYYFLNLGRLFLSFIKIHLFYMEYY